MAEKIHTTLFPICEEKFNNISQSQVNLHKKIDNLDRLLRNGLAARVTRMEAVQDGHGRILKGIVGLMVSTIGVVLVKVVLPLVTA